MELVTGCRSLLHDGFKRHWLQNSDEWIACAMNRYLRTCDLYLIDWNATYEFRPSDRTYTVSEEENTQENRWLNCHLAQNTHTHSQIYTNIHAKFCFRNLWSNFFFSYNARVYIIHIISSWETCSPMHTHTHTHTWTQLKISHLTEFQVWQIEMLQNKRGKIVGEYAVISKICRIWKLESRNKKNCPLNWQQKLLRKSGRISRNIETKNAFGLANISKYFFKVLIIYQWAPSIAQPHHTNDGWSFTLNFGRKLNNENADCVCAALKAFDFWMLLKPNKCMFLFWFSNWK